MSVFGDGRGAPASGLTAPNLGPAFTPEATTGTAHASSLEVQQTYPTKSSTCAESAFWPSGATPVRTYISIVRSATGIAAAERSATP